AGDECGPNALRFQHAAGRDARRQNRRLRRLREHEVGFGTFKAQRTERSRPARLCKRGVCLVERASRLGIRCGEGLAHADLLRSLPWKHEGDHAGFLVTAMASISCATREVKCAAAKRDARPIAFSMAL